MSGSGRANKSGLGYEVEKKMEANYDREEAAGTPTHVVNWVNAILGSEHDPIVDQYFIEKRWKVTNQFQKKVMSPFVAMTNIENFNKGCQDYGVDRESEFQSGDLWEVRKGPFLNVINCIHSLGFVANKKKVSPQYTGEIRKYMDNE